MSDTDSQLVQHYPLRCNSLRASQGFTLVEIVVGIVTLGIVLVILSVLIFPQAQRSAEPVLQTRAAALGQALLAEISSKAFDENSSFSGGMLRCGETGADPCTAIAEFGPDGGETRDRFNDVDDYHLLQERFQNLENALGEDLAARYPNFGFAVDVCYSNELGVCDTEVTLFKRVRVTITTPTGQDLVFSTIRGNY